MARGLLIVDIQNDYFPGGRHELVGPEQAGEQAALLLERFRHAGAPVVHLQHVWDAPDAAFFQPGTPGSRSTGASRRGPASRCSRRPTRTAFATRR